MLAKAAVQRYEEFSTGKGSGGTTPQPGEFLSESRDRDLSYKSGSFRQNPESRWRCRDHCRRPRWGEFAWRGRYHFQNSRGGVIPQQAPTVALQESRTECCRCSLCLPRNTSLRCRWSGIGGSRHLGLREHRVIQAARRQPTGVGWDDTDMEFRSRRSFPDSPQTSHT